MSLVCFLNDHDFGDWFVVNERVQAPTRRLCTVIDSVKQAPVCQACQYT